jgi:hypothetical protein
MVNRRQFFSGFLNASRTETPSGRDRTPRYRALETYVLVDLIPYDLVLTAEQDVDLRARVHALLDDTTTDELFSMAVVGKLEKMTQTFMNQIGEVPG